MRVEMVKGRVAGGCHDHRLWTLFFFVVRLILLVWTYGERRVVSSRVLPAGGRGFTFHITIKRMKSQF